MNFLRRYISLCSKYSFVLPVRITSHSRFISRECILIVFIFNNSVRVRWTLVWGIKLKYVLARFTLRGLIQDSNANNALILHYLSLLFDSRLLEGTSSSPPWEAYYLLHLKRSTRQEFILSRSLTITSAFDLSTYTWIFLICITCSFHHWQLPIHYHEFLSFNHSKLNTKSLGFFKFILQLKYRGLVRVSLVLCMTDLHRWLLQADGIIVLSPF